MNKNTALLIIDPQNDFCDPAGSLYVPGADKDMHNLAALIQGLNDQIESIHITMDTHQDVDISHPGWWVDRNGRHPDPFTLFGVDELEAGTWAPANPETHARSLSYLQSLEKAGRYPHTIWPYHCIAGSHGHAIYPVLMKALREWSQKNFKRIDYVAKGENMYTEHFSGIKAEVVDGNDPRTRPNRALVNRLEAADTLLIAGEALSHCLMSTIEDLADAYTDPASIKKMILLEDTTSLVPDPPGAEGLFSNKAKAFLETMQNRGMRVLPTHEFLK